MSTSTINWAELVKQAPTFAPVEAWKPTNAGDQLVGMLARVDQRPPQNGYAEYPILIVLTDDGQEWAVHAFHTVLKDQLLKTAPQVGDRIRLTYKGKVQGQTREYHSWTVEVRRAEQ